MAPETSAPVITQNSPWKTANRITGYAESPLLSALISWPSPAYWVGSPSRPAPTSSPNASE